MLRRAWQLFPWTPFGLAVGGAAAAGDRWFAAPEDDYVLRVVAGAVLLLCVLAALGVGASLLALRRALRRTDRPDLAGEAERGAVKGLELPFFGGWLAMRLEVDWVEPRGARPRLVEGLGSDRREEVRFTRRQGRDRVVRRFRIEDPFGLARMEWSESEAQRLRVAPWRGALDRCPALASLARGDLVPHPSGPALGDPMDLRPYQPGDPLRLVAWKLYARTGELDVRVPERAFSPRTRTAAYLVTTTDDEPAAAAAWVAIERDLLGRDWVFATDGAEPTSDPDRAKDAILHSGGRNREGQDLAAFLEMNRKGGSAHVILFVPGRPGPWLERVSSLAGPDVVVVAVVDGLIAPVRSSHWWRRPDPVEGDRLRVTRAQVDRVAAAFERRGAQVLALSRTDGRAVSHRMTPKERVA